MVNGDRRFDWRKVQCFRDMEIRVHLLKSDWVVEDGGGWMGGWWVEPAGRAWDDRYARLKKGLGLLES